jgi:probable DNA repair protein
MLPPLFSIDTILQECKSGQLILTPNQRLSDKILQAWGDYQYQQGLHIWKSPTLFSIEKWFIYCWHQLQSKNWPASRYVIASDNQQSLLWEKISRDDSLNLNESIAKHSHQAYKLLERWNLSIESINDHGKYYQVNEQFIEWAKEYKKQLAQRNWITQEHACRIIGKAFETDILAKENIIHLLNFDDVLPIHKVQLLKASHTLNEINSNTKKPESLKRLEFENNEQELIALTQWAKNILKKQPQSRIGIIVPNLGQTRKTVEHFFTSEFESHSYSPEVPRYTLPFNFSAGIPLSETPLLASTLNILKLQQEQWPLELIVNILFSPFWGNYNQEIQERCLLATQLQTLGSFTISKKDLIYRAEKISADKYITGSEERTCNSLFDQLNSYFSQAPSFINNKKQTPSSWIDIFLINLELLNWPGERVPDSEEYQQTQLWYKALETFANFDEVLGEVSFDQALFHLQKLLNKTPFQAEVPDSPIQILGILEGAGLHFTHCWVIGLDQQAWPPAPAPNPMLPTLLQREQAMPHSSHLRELAFATSLTDNYRHCANEVIFSSSKNKPEFQETLLPSPLIKSIPLSDCQHDQNETSVIAYANTLSRHKNLQLVECKEGPPPGSDLLPGGTGLLKAQSENPFNAFAQYRLKAVQPPEPVNGFSAIDKGHILHNSMSSIWRQLVNQQQLLATPAPDLIDLIKQSVQEQVYQIYKKKPLHLNRTLCEIEIDRQIELIRLWLEQEKQRPPFTVIATEESRTISLDGVNFKVRIDRVDQLEDGSLLILDYKTGKTDILSWMGERPREPQLPLYAISYDQHVCGIAFIQISIHDQIIKGYSSIADLFKPTKSRNRLPASWEEALEEWQTTISALIKQIKTGDCRIDFRDNEAIRYSQELVSINRYHEAKAIITLMESSLESS